MQDLGHLRNDCDSSPCWQVTYGVSMGHDLPDFAHPISFSFAFTFSHYFEILIRFYDLSLIFCGSEYSTGKVYFSIFFKVTILLNPVVISLLFTCRQFFRILFVVVDRYSCVCVCLLLLFSGLVIKMFFTIQKIKILFGTRVMPLKYQAREIGLMKLQ